VSKVAPHKYGEKTALAVSGSLNLAGLLESLPVIEPPPRKPAAE
jgi:hypothetical protein